MNNNELDIIKYSEQDILDAFGVINKNIKEAIDRKVHLNIPSTLNYLLLEYFVAREMGSITNEFNKAGQMLLKAYNDIQQYGHFKYTNGEENGKI